MQMNRNHFDREEQQIYEAFSQIEVRHTDMAGRVMGQVQDAPKMHVSGVRKRAPILAVALVILLVSTVALAVGLGGFDWFLERFEPNFAEIVEPIEVYAEDQGIRMTVIGAQQFDRMAIVYLSVQDISGENRLTEQMSFLDGFRLWGADEAQPGMSWRQTMLYFDGDRNTAYFEIQIIAESTLADLLEIGAANIFFHTHMFWDEPVDLSLAGLSEMETISIGQGHMFTGFGMMDGFPESLEILVPGNIAPMPHGDPRQWISNIGIVDGRLRVQYGGCYVVRNMGLGPGDASFTLLSPTGEIVQPVMAVSFLMDEGFVPIDVWAGEGDQSPVYRFEEYFFDVDLDRLAYYILAYSGQAALGVSGNWRVRVDTGDTSSQMIALTTDLAVDGFRLEFITLSPLGLQIRGSLYAGVAYMPGLDVSLETEVGVIQVGEGGGLYIPFDPGFNLDWQFEAPLDVSMVTAVVINGQRVLLA